MYSPFLFVPPAAPPSCSD